jgi:hypothetical protein
MPIDQDKTIDIETKPELYDYQIQSFASMQSTQAESRMGKTRNHKQNINHYIDLFVSNSDYDTLRKLILADKDILSVSGDHLQPQLSKIKSDQIFIKNKPAWNKFFNQLHFHNHRLKHLTIWTDLIDIVNKHSKILNNKMNPQRLFKDLQLGRFIYEENLFEIKTLFNKHIIESKVKKIMNKHFTKRYKFLINDENTKIIYKLLENDLSIKDIEKNITSKIITIKDDNDLTHRLKNLLMVSLNWTLDYYLNIVNNNKVEIIENNTTSLILSIHHYQELCLFAPDSWCIKTNESSFYDHVDENSQQFIELNFEEYPNSKYAIIGVTRDFKGNIVYAHDKFNDCIKGDEIIKKYNNLKINKKKYSLKNGNFYFKT